MWGAGVALEAGSGRSAVCDGHPVTGGFRPCPAPSVLSQAPGGFRVGSVCQVSWVESLGGSSVLGILYGCTQRGIPEFSVDVYSNAAGAVAFRN